MCLKSGGECGLTFWPQRSERIGEKFSPVGLISDTIAFDQCQALRVAKRVLRHGVQDFVLVVLGDRGETDRACRTDLSLAEGGLSLGGELGYQRDSLDDPGPLLSEHLHDSRHRHLVIDLQGMRDTGLVKRSDRASWGVGEQKPFLEFGGRAALLDNDRDFGIAGGPP